MALVTMKKLLERARQKDRGVGAFSVGNMEMIRGAVKAAEEMQTPIILQIAEVRLKHSPLELMARVNSQLRRYTRFKNREGNEAKNGRIYINGGLELNEDTVEVLVDGRPARMTPIEFKILALLMKNPGRVFSAEEIYERVWNERAINTDTIMVHVRNIRDKIEINPKEPKYLKVVWGIGYKIEKQP